MKSLKAKREKARAAIWFMGPSLDEDRQRQYRHCREYWCRCWRLSLAWCLGVTTGGTLGAATLTGGSTGNYVYTDLTRKGVDENTALKVAGVNAVGDAIGTALPIGYGFKGTGGLVADAALSVGGATGLNTGMQYASEQLLKSEGYS